jgi:hypothetical protein
MLKVSDEWERALHAPAMAVAQPGDVAVVARTDPQEQEREQERERERESVVTMTLPPHLAELGGYPVASP